MELLITDVTYMHNDHICVAGWDLAAQAMVRPVAGPSHPWTVGQAGRHLFQVGNIVRFKPTGSAAGRRPPHGWEDKYVNPQADLVATMAPAELTQTLRQTESPSVATLFRDTIYNGKAVLQGTDCPSLGAIGTFVRQIGFRSAKEGRQLRCWFYDAANGRYNLPVSGKAIRDAFQAGGVDAVKALSTGHRRAHIRLGLANPFDGDDKCYIMVNHIHFHG